jgi:hypothetical protein
MTNTNYIASILDPTGGELIDVDIRTLDSDKLAALRQDAASHGDSDLVAAIDSL